MKTYKEQNEFTLEEMELVESWLVGELGHANRASMASTWKKQILRQQLANVRDWIKGANLEIEKLRCQMTYGYRG